MHNKATGNAAETFLSGSFILKAFIIVKSFHS
jgi:hypothetical protein